MADFVKWHGIENSYQQKNIDWWLERYPELANETYIITEKIHGSNLQWFVQPNTPVQAGSRNHWLDTNGSFNGANIQELMEKETAVLTYFQNKADKFGNSYRLYGELFGDGIQKGVRYGPEKRILYFGLMINKFWQPFLELTYLTYIMDKNPIVPQLSIVHNLKEALQFDPAFDSKILNESGNLAEAIVIMPYYKVYQEQSTFILKIKNESFNEKAKAKKPVIIDSEVDMFHMEFLRFVNDNRLQSVFSKHGTIESKQQIGDYLKLLVEDAKEDFLKEYDIYSLDAGQQKKVFNIGSIGFQLLKEYL